MKTIQRKPSAPLTRQQIIDLFDNDPGAVVRLDIIEKYRNSLRALYTDRYEGVPILMVTDIFNACAYGRITTEFNYLEDLEAYLTDPGNDFDAETIEIERENIEFNSTIL